MIYQIFLILLPLVTTPYVSRVLGSEGVGTYSFTLSITTYFVLIGTLGVGLYGRREIAFKQNDKAERSKTFWQINIVKWIAMSISIFIFYFTCINNSEYGSYFFIFALELLAQMFDISWYFQGMEQFKTLTIRNFIVKLISVSCIFLFVKNPNDLWLYVLIYCLSNLISNLSLWVILPRTISKVKLSLKDAKKHAFPIFLLFLPQATIEIYTVLDKTMLGFLVNDMKEVGVYEQSQKVEKVSLYIITALGPVMSARIANLFAEGKKKEITETLKKAFHFVLLMAVPLCFGIAGVASTLVPWFLGEEFLSAIPIMQIGSLLIFAIALSNVAGSQFLVPTKRQGVFTASVVTGAIVNLIGNLILIPFLHGVGAIIASVLAEFSVSIVQLRAIRKDFKMRDVFSPLKTALPAGIIMFICVLGLGFIVPKTILGTAVQVIVGGLVYLIITTILKDSLVLEGWKTANKFKNKLLKHHE